MFFSWKYEKEYILTTLKKMWDHEMALKFIYLAKKNITLVISFHRTSRLYYLWHKS